LGNDGTAGQFVFEPVGSEPPGGRPAGSILYEEHLKLTEKSHIAEFAGYLMPLWYSSISAEHEAVRERAGFFDCTHMGVLEVSGGAAEEFLNIVATNDVTKLSCGSAQYSYILDAAGNVLDDIIIYRCADDDFMVVVNAANEPKIKAYFAALLGGKAMLDAEEPAARIERKPLIRDMRARTGYGKCRVDIALQGPRSVDVLCELSADVNFRRRLDEIKAFRFVEAEVGGIDALVARTGYTGAKVGFELFVSPEEAPGLWQKLVDVGKQFGAIPCGLGARDSLRIEAGLPLYGHELAGRFNISPFEAGYGWAVKLDKPFFIGKAAMQHAAETCEMKVIRLELPGEKGVRPVRQSDGVLDRNGQCIGWVLSCAKAGKRQVALVYVPKDAANEGDEVAVYYLARSAGQKARGKKGKVDRGEKLDADITGRVVGRFEKF